MQEVFFLQGLLLQSPNHWPSFLPHDFRKHHEKCWSTFQSHGLSVFQASVQFVRQCKGLEAVLVGVLSANELRQILNAWQQEWPEKSTSLFNRWGWNSKDDIDPRCWPSY